MTGSLKDNLTRLAQEVQVVDLHDRVLRESRRMTIRNRMAGSVAALLAIAGITTAVTSLPSAPTPEPPAASETPTPSPSPSETPKQPPNVDIRHATLQIPDFPGDPNCPGGTRKFTDGKSKVGKSGDQDVVLEMHDEPVRGDVDGKPGDEILIRLQCRAYTSSGQVLAVRVSPEATLTSLGFVLMSPDHQGFSVLDGSLRWEAGVVLVDVYGPDRADGPLTVLDLQTRGYRYGDGKFTQVSGPRKFAVPPADYRRIDFKNTTIRVAVPGTPWPDHGLCRTTDGTGTVTIGKQRYRVEVVASAFFTGLPRAAALLRLTPESGGAVRTILNVYSVPYGVTDDTSPGIVDQLEGATKVETAGTDLKITINGQVRTYREQDGGKWVRV